MSEIIGLYSVTLCKLFTSIVCERIMKMKYLYFLLEGLSKLCSLSTLQNNPGLFTVRKERKGL